MKEFQKTIDKALPNDWQKISLGKIGEPKMCKRILKTQTQEMGDVPFYKIGTFGGIADAFISFDVFFRYKQMYSYPKNGEVLISAAGTIGRLVVYQGEQAYYQDSNIVWIANDEKRVYNNFLYYALKGTDWDTSQGTIQRLYNNSLKAKEINIPSSLSEQHRIATALSDIDTLITSLGKLIDKKRHIKLATMQQLLTGRKRLKGFSEPWEEKKLGDIAEMYSGGTPSSKVVSYYIGKIPFLSISDMTSQSKYTFYTDKHITKDAIENSSARMVKKGTILYAMYASLGKCSIAGVDMAISQAVLGIFEDNEQLDKYYLYYYLSFIEKTVVKMGQTGTQSNLSKQLVQEFELYLPSDVKEQRAIAQVLSDMDSDISSLEHRQAKLKAVKQGMMQQLLTGRIRLIDNQ